MCVCICIHVDMSITPVSVYADEWASARRCPCTIEYALEHGCPPLALAAYLCREMRDGVRCDLFMGLHRQNIHDTSTSPSLPPLFRLVSTSPFTPLSSLSSTSLSSERHEKKTDESVHVSRKRVREKEEDEDGGEIREEHENGEENNSDFLPSDLEGHEVRESVRSRDEDGLPSESIKSAETAKTQNQKKNRRKR